MAGEPRRQLGIKYLIFVVITYTDNGTIVHLCLHASSNWGLHRRTQIRIVGSISTRYAIIVSCFAFSLICNFMCSHVLILRTNIRQQQKKFSHPSECVFARKGSRRPLVNQHEVYGYKRIMASKRVVLAAGLVLISLLVGVESHNTCKFPAIYNFGDSNSDTGGISAALGVVPPPNGETFFHKPVGRACDGRLVLDFIAENLGLPYMSPYLDSVGTDFRHGANFATGGSSIRPGGYSPFHLGIQINQFVRFKSRTTELYKQHGATGNLPRPDGFSKALYIFDIGQNDLSYGFQYNVTELVLASLPDILSQFTTALLELYKEGARNFWIHNTGPIGCLPYSIIYHEPKTSGLDRIGCVETQNYVARAFNRQLKERLDKLIQEHPHASFTYFDMYTAKYELFSHAKKKGLKDPFAFCCGSFYGYHINCGKTVVVNGTLYGKPCRDPSKYVSWDGVHNTEASNKKIASHIIDGSLSTPSRAIGNACSRPLHY